MSDKKTVAILGGTGSLGQGIAVRLAKAGHDVVIGSRDAQRACTLAAELAADCGGQVAGAAYEDAVHAAEIVFLALPFAAQNDTLRGLSSFLQGKLLVDTTVPLVPPRVARVQLPESDSAAVATQAMLGEGVRVVSALQNVAATHLRALDHDLDCDVLVCGDDKEARGAVIGLVEAMGIRGWHAGPLANSTVAEAMTSVLIFLNKTYGIEGAGIRITGIPTKTV